METWEEFCERVGVDPDNEYEHMRWENALFLGRVRWDGQPLDYLELL